MSVGAMMIYNGLFTLSDHYLWKLGRVSGLNDFARKLKEDSSMTMSSLENFRKNEYNEWKATVIGNYTLKNICQIAAGISLLKYSYDRF